MLPRGGVFDRVGEAGLHLVDQGELRNHLREFLDDLCCNNDAWEAKRMASGVGKNNDSGEDSSDGE